MLNLYYGEQDAGLYVATNAFSLACALGLGLNPHGVQELLARNRGDIPAERVRSSVAPRRTSVRTSSARSGARKILSSAENAVGG